MFNLFLSYDDKYIQYFVKKSQISMSNQQTTAQGHNSLKSVTGAFDLQTKIRLIIQQVLTATMRKISQFHEKVQNFQRFFFTYKQRMDDVEEKGKINEQTLTRFFQTVMKNKQHSENQFIKAEERHQRLKLEKNQIQQQIKQLNKKLASITKQNQNIVSEFSKSKSKFLQYEEKITGMKEEVSWKISKYIEETAETNKAIQISNQKLQNEYFNINLSLKKNLEKYQEIISTKDQQESLNQQYSDSLEFLQNNLKEKGQSINLVNKKLQEMDTALYSKIKLVQSKLQRRVQQLWQSNAKIQVSVAKVQNFSIILEEVREDSQKTRRQLMKKFQQSDQKHTQAIQKQVLNLNMSILKFQKSQDKKIKSITQSQQKNIEHFNQKLQFLKIEIQGQISSKATKMLEEKSQNHGNVAMSLVQQIQQKMNKLNSDTKKQILKMQSSIKQVKKQVSSNMTEMKESVETKMTQAMKIIDESSSSGLNPEFLKAFNQKIQNITESIDFKFNQFSKQIQEQGIKVQKVQNMKVETQIKLKTLMQENAGRFTQLQQKLSGKVQRILYTVTKMRGDSIIRNQFIDKQIKELKRLLSKSDKDTMVILKIFPAIGQCINLMMCLIFDAEFQHSKVIQQGSPNPVKTVVKFQNLVQGTLYQYTQKKKLGCIQYRHKEQNKTQIVRATFNAYNQVWQELFSSQFKNKVQLMPKNFYKRYVQKNMGIVSRGSPNKDQVQSGPTIKQIGSKKSLQKMKILSQDSRGSIRQQLGKNSDNMNRSFHIRKKKISTIKTKDDLIMVVQQDVIEQR